MFLSGRWYKAPALKGPWSYVASDELPKSFKDIPKDSDSADVLAYVAGTLEAREAVLDAQIPQTATVKRGSVDLDVEYDGDPQFQAIDGTSLYRAVNTADQVIKDGETYYLVRDANNHRPEKRRRSGLFKRRTRRGRGSGLPDHFPLRTPGR